jgi:Domain of unknown function (DUF397)
MMLLVGLPMCPPPRMESSPAIFASKCPLRYVDCWMPSANPSNRMKGRRGVIVEVEGVCEMRGSENISPRWFKSSASDPDSCVEVRFIENAVQVRDSKDPEGPVLTFTDREWEAFLAGVRFQEFDRAKP